MGVLVAGWLHVQADGDLIPAARRAHYEYRSALKLMKQRSAIWSPRVISVSSLEQTGIDKAWSNMLESVGRGVPRCGRLCTPTPMPTHAAIAWVAAQRRLRGRCA